MTRRYIFPTVTQLSVNVTDNLSLTLRLTEYCESEDDDGDRFTSDTIYSGQRVSQQEEVNSVKHITSSPIKRF